MTRYVDREAKPLPMYLPITDASAKAVRAFWRGIFIGAAVGLAVGVMW